MTLTEAQDIVETLAAGPYYRDNYRRWEMDYLPFLTDRVADLKPGRALEVGPGWGTMLVFLSALGWRMEAMDIVQLGVWIKPALLELTRTRWHAHDILGAPLDCDGTPPHFDLILCTQVLPHLKFRADRALRHIKKMLAPDGRLIVSALDCESYRGIQSAYGLDWRAVPEYGTAEPSPEMNICMFSQNTFRELLSLVFPEVHLWRGEGSTVMFAECTK